MKNKNINIILIIFGALAIVLLIFFIFNNKKNYNWYESYNSESDQPYGVSFIRQLLEGTRKDGTFIVQKKKRLEELLNEPKFSTETDYVFIGQSLSLQEDDKTALLNFIANGNDAFISTLEIPEFLLDAYDRECGQLIILDENYSESATLNFYHADLQDKYGYKYTYRYGTFDQSYNWASFNPGIFCDSTRHLTPLGYVTPNAVNFLRISHGKGTIYLHCNPLVFTNYFLIKKQKLEYATAAFSHLKGKNTIWDEFGKVPLMGGSNTNDSPLYYIMQQRSLKFAWWMIVVSIILYVLFAAKRTQRAIPILDVKTNTSLEFVKLIAALHFQNKDHLNMARKKMKYFNYFIRSKYGINGQPFTEEMVNKLAEKSRVPLPDVKAIFNLYKLIEEGSGGTIEAPRLSNFYFAVENFYKQSK